MGVALQSVYVVQLMSKIWDLEKLIVVNVL